MPYSFSTPITSGMSLQDSSIWQTLIDACNERLQAIPWTAANGAHVEAYDLVTATAYTSASAGTSIQMAAWWNQQGSTGSSALIGVISDWSGYIPFPLGLQSTILYLYPYFCDHRIYYEGNTTDLFLSYDPSTGLSTVLGGGGTRNGPNAAWTVPTLRDAAGLPVTINPNLRDNFPASYTPNIWFRRKRPREILFTSDTVDRQGNTASIGQRAYQGYESGYQQLYKYDGAAWVRDNTGSVDILDNTLDWPNAITVYSDSNGMAEHGDYVGDWLFEEIRVMLNQLRWRWDVVSDRATMTMLSQSASNTQTSFDQYTSYISNADLNTNLAANWTGTTYTMSGGATGPQAFIYNLFDSTGTYWFGFVDRVDSVWTLNDLGPLTKDVLFFVYPQATSADGDLTSGGAGSTYDAQGDPIGGGGYHAWHTVSATTSASLTTPQFGDSTVYPPNSPTPPTGPSDAEAKGYEVIDAVAITKFNFTYTF